MIDQDLREFMKERQQELDQVEQPDLNRLWNDFNRKSEGKIIPLHYWTIAAAIALVIALTAGLIGYYLANSGDPSLEALFAEQQIEQHYLNVLQDIELREQQIASQQINRDHFQALYEAIEELDSVREIYVADLSSHTNEPHLIRSLLRQYEKKAHLLQLLLLEIEKKSKNEQRNNFTNL